MATTSRYYDGDYAVGFYDGPPVVTYPFINNPTPDRYAKQIRRTWKQRGVDYVPANANRTSYTNTTLQSQTLGQSPWATNFTLTITENAATAPDGTTTANLLVDTSASNADRYQYSTIPNDSLTRTASVFLKQSTATKSVFIFSLEGGTAISSSAEITWATNSVVYTGSGTNTLVDCGDGWFRLTSTLTNNASGNVNALVLVRPDSSSPSGTGGALAWGAQIVTGSLAGPYIPTTTVSRTVSAPDPEPGDDINEADQLAYLVAEAEQDRDISDTVRVQRVFSRIPQPQTTPTFLRISKPSISGTFPQAFGDFRIFQPDATLQRFDAYAAQTVTSDSGAPTLYPTGGTYTLTFDGATTGAIPYNHSAAQVEAELDALTPVVNRGGCAVTGSYNSAGGFTVTFAAYGAATSAESFSFGPGVGGIGFYNTTAYNGYIQSCRWESSGFEITGGTFTLTIFTQTTAAIAYNASAASVQSALNALSNVSSRGGCVVTTMGSSILQNGFLINFSIQFSNPAITGDASSLTPAPSFVSVLSVDGILLNYKQSISLLASSTRTLFFESAHGISASDTIFLYSGSTYYSAIPSTDFSIPSTTSVELSITPALAYASAGTITLAGKRTKANYAPGSGSIRGEATTSFYLPGVTAGITTGADVPQVEDQGDPTPFLLATFAGTGNINMSVGQLQPWNGTTILSQEITTIKAEDV